MKKIFKRVLIIAIIFLLSAAPSHAVTKYEFLSHLLHARGIDWSTAPEANYNDPAGFMIRSGYVTDNVKDLNAQVTRREALRWCVESFGLSFEASLFTDYPSGFKDEKKFPDFDRGCLVVASNMKPAVWPKAENFRGYDGLTAQEAAEIYERVRAASNFFTLDMIRNPLNGMRIFIHREGVPTGMPEWRFFATGIRTQTAADIFKSSLKNDEGIDVSVVKSTSSYGIRTQKLSSYDDIRKLIMIAEARGLSYKILPSMTNPNTRILPRFWVMLVIDPAIWKIRPMTSGNGANEFTTLSNIASGNWAGAAINGGFFSVIKSGYGYPIGALKIDGKIFSQPYENRGTLGWNDKDIIFKISTEDIYYWDEMTNIIQGGPLMLLNGNSIWVDEGFNSALLSTRHPRSAIGINSSGEWIFFVIDGRNGFHSSGATIAELTEILRGQKITYALNLDGGGSTEIIINGKIYNSPSDGYERNISYALGAIPAK